MLYSGDVEVGRWKMAWGVRVMRGCVGGCERARRGAELEDWNGGRIACWRERP